MWFDIPWYDMSRMGTNLFFGKTIISSNFGIKFQHVIDIDYYNTNKYLNLPRDTRYDMSKRFFSIFHFSGTTRHCVNEILTCYKYIIVPYTYFSLPRDIWIGHGGKPNEMVDFKFTFRLLSFNVKLVPNFKQCIFKIFCSIYLYSGSPGRLMEIDYLKI